MNIIKPDSLLFNQAMLDEEYPFSKQERKVAEKASKIAVKAFEKGLIKSLKFRNMLLNS